MPSFQDVGYYRFFKESGSRECHQKAKGKHPDHIIPAKDKETYRRDEWRVGVGNKSINEQYGPRKKNIKCCTNLNSLYVMWSQINSV